MPLGVSASNTAGLSSFNLRSSVCSQRGFKVRVKSSSCLIASLLLLTQCLSLHRSQCASQFLSHYERRCKGSDSNWHSRFRCLVLKLWVYLWAEASPQPRAQTFLWPLSSFLRVFCQLVLSQSLVHTEFLSLALSNATCLCHHPSCLQLCHIPVCEVRYNWYSHL